ncbi:hypothetical protein EG68_06767 [Paragonimus skrjabini miyazakii]|uniref:Uncharacterized protein n=1 Tax=Paragonimus skrjabini miyazakii TaxID=59628 RepID=A0A8S9YLZ4_9TREM|nr:hypothetical protein EG68_06767 [Paragonimus skrjabini miyazakii]
MNEVTQDSSELRALLASNSLVKDTLDELYTNPQTSILEPTVSDYISLVNKGEVLGSQAPGSSRATEYAIEYFCAMTKHLRNVMTWSIVKDPVHHDLCIANFEHTVRHALTVSQMIARHIESFMGGAAKLKNVPDLLQRAVNGDAEANQELLSLLGQGKGSFLLSSVQQTQGQVVDRILRHCATETQIEEIEAMLRQTQSEDNGETIKRLVDGWMRLFKNASKLAVKLGVSNTIKRTKSLLLTKDFQRLISRLPGELEMKHEPDDIVPMTAAELDVIHQTAISAAAIPTKTKYPALVKRKLLFKRTSSVGRSAMNDRKGETYVQSRKPKSLQKTDVMLSDLVLPDSVESVTDESGTGKPTSKRRLTSDQLMTTPESGTYLDAVTIPVSRGKTKPVEGSFEMAAKRLTYQPVRLKALKEDTKISAAKLKPQVLSTPSPTPKAESLTSTQKLEQLRKEERAILNIKRSRGISRLELQKLVNRLQSHQLVPKLPPMLISKISDTDVVEQAHVVMATDEEVTAVLEHVQNAMAALIISELIEQSKTRRSPTDSRKSTNAKTFLSFMRRGSTLMKDTVSSAARKANLTGVEDTLDTLQKESDEKGLLGVVHQSSSSDDLLSWDSSSASSPRGHHQLDRLRKLNEMQEKYTADANLLVAEIAQETLLLNEQEMKVLMFNTFLVENLQKLFARLEAEQEDWTSGSSRRQAARLEEFRHKLSTFIQESTNDLPIETQNKMSSAVNALINELQTNLAKLAEYSPTVREQPREDEEPEQGFMSTETFEQLNAALQSMFMNRLKTVAESLTFTGVSIKSDLSELKQAIKTRTEVIQNMVATLQSELLQGVDIPPVVNTIIRRRLSELGREVRRRVKQQAKQLAKERRKTIHRTFRVSLLNVHRTPSSQLSSSSFSSDSRGQEGREITFPDAAAAAADDDDDDRKEVKTTVKLEGFYESQEQHLPVGGIQTKVTKLQEKPSYTSTRSQLPVSQDSIRTKSTLAMRKPDMVGMVEYIVNQLEQYTDYNSNELELIRQIFHMMSQSDQPVPKPEQVDFMRERYIEITEEHPRLHLSLLTKLQNVGKTTSSRHSSRAGSLFADDPEGVKMKVFMNSLRNSLKSQTTDPSILEAQINLLEQSVTNIMENLELYSFPKLRMDNAVMTGSQDITVDSYLRKQKCRSPEGWAISLPLIGSDSTAHRITRLGGSQVTRSSKLKFKDSIMGISIEGINIGVRKLTDFSWKTKVPEPALASKVSSFVGVGHDGEESIEVSGVGQEQDDHLSTESHPERKDLKSSTGSSLTYRLPLHTELLADVKGEQPDEVTTTITKIPSSEPERSSDGHSANTPTTVRSKHIPKRSTVLTPVDVKGEQPDEVTTTITKIPSSEPERSSDGHSANTPTTVRSKHIPKRSTVLTPVLNVPRNSRVMSRPSWIPCRDWSRLVGPIAHPVVIYKTNEKIEAHFRRAVDLHIFPTTLQTRYDLGDVFKRATILSKNRLRLPPIGPYA